VNDDEQASLDMEAYHRKAAAAAANGWLAAMHREIADGIRSSREERETP